MPDPEVLPEILRRIFNELDGLIQAEVDQAPPELVSPDVLEGIAHLHSALAAKLGVNHG